VPPSATGPDAARARPRCYSHAAHDGTFLAELKLVVRDGIRVFEELEARAADEGGEQLLEALLAVPEVVRRYCAAGSRV
jgi:hypothetical protein